ncbi:DUF6286 domain-containing protein [Actinomadura viridis]|uniref:DUF6286 domain-containing protein n=1 Tax=Actinomadura viridis TaxID=58110 RepID=UPI003691E2AB
MTTHAGRLPRSRERDAEPNRARSAAASRRAARRAFHSRRIWPALLASLILAAAGVITAIETISALAGSPLRFFPYEQITSWAVRTPWNDRLVMLIAAAIALLGLVFLLAGLFPGRGRLIPLYGEDPDLVVGITRSGLRTLVATAARSVDGVTGVGHVRLRRRKIKVKVRTALRQPHDLHERVRAAVRERLDEVGPLPRRGIAVRIRFPKD